MTLLASVTALVLLPLPVLLLVSLLVSVLLLLPVLLLSLTLPVVVLLLLPVVVLLALLSLVRVAFTTSALLAAVPAVARLPMVLVPVGLEGVLAQLELLVLSSLLTAVVVLSTAALLVTLAVLLPSVLLALTPVPSRLLRATLATALLTVLALLVAALLTVVASHPGHHVLDLLGDTAVLVALLPSATTLLATVLALQPAVLALLPVVLPATIPLALSVATMVLLSMLLRAASVAALLLVLALVVPALLVLLLTPTLLVPTVRLVRSVRLVPSALLPVAARQLLRELVAAPMAGPALLAVVLRAPVLPLLAGDPAAAGLAGEEGPGVPAVAAEGAAVQPRLSRRAVDSRSLSALELPFVSVHGENSGSMALSGTSRAPGLVSVRLAAPPSAATSARPRNGGIPAVRPTICGSRRRGRPLADWKGEGATRFPDEASTAGPSARGAQRVAGSAGP